MASSSRRMSHPPTSHINLHCLQCDNQIGIFDNQWTRLTSSYVRPVQPGTHFGTEIATNKTQVVPEGVSQRSLEGCTLAEVFCTKCSAAVGQYCKATPGPEYRNMLKQYLYKLSKTYLKNGDTNEEVDPIFGYGGDAVRATTRTSATPRLSLPAVPRWSHTPLHRDETPSRLQPMTASGRRTSAPISFQNNNEPSSFGGSTYGELDDTAAVRDTRLKVQEQRMAAQDEKTQQHENQLRVISSILDAFRGTLEDIKTSIKELHSQNSTPHVENPTQIDYVANLHSMITTMKTAQSNARELEQLRAENAALKAKWDIVQSALAAAAANPAPSSSLTASHRNSLGKRKRDSDIVKSAPAPPPEAVMQNRSYSYGNASSSTQVPTPQSSNYSDNQSQNASSSSRTTTPEEVHGDSDPHDVSQNGKKSKLTATRTPLESSSQRAGKKERILEPSQPTKMLSPAVRFALGDGSDAVLQPSTGASVVQEEQRPKSASTAESSQSAEQDDALQISTPAESVTGTTENEPQPQPGQDTSSPEDDDQPLGYDDEPPMNVDTTTTDNRLSLGESVEFSDDEQGRPSSSEGPAAEQTENRIPSEDRESSSVDIKRGIVGQTRNTFTPDDAATQSAPAGRTRSKTKAASTPRNTTGTDFIQDTRSVAPEPPSARRILPRRLNPDQTGQFEHATPKTVEQELRELEKPKAPRQYKTHVQTTTKLLNIELKELGLEEWIGKDKNVPEYKKVVEEARERKREQTRLAALTSRRVNVPGATANEASRPSTPTLDQAFQEAASALVEVTNEQNIPRKISEQTAAAARRASGVKTGRRKKTKEEREEEIRKRDELAKAAMETD